MYPGKKFRIGETEYTVPALALGQLRNGGLELIKKSDELAQAGKPFEAIAMRGQIVAMAVKRNYPDVDAEALMDSLDLDNMNSLWLHVLGASSLLPEALAPVVKAEAVKTD
jgi:hypothetical protein